MKIYKENQYELCPPEKFFIMILPEGDDLHMPKLINGRAWTIRGDGYYSDKHSVSRIAIVKHGYI